jgi:hypothetical protein
MSTSAHEAAPAAGPDITPPAATPRAGTASPPEKPPLDALILAAAESVGEDGNGAGGAFGYMRRLAINDPRVFASLLAKGLPPDDASQGGVLQTIFNTVYQHVPR